MHLREIPLYRNLHGWISLIWFQVFCYHWVCILILGLGYGFSIDGLILSYFLLILGRSCLIFIVFWVSIVLTGFGGGGFNEWWWWWLGGDGWTVLGGWWNLHFGGSALASSVRLCGCVCVCVCVYQRKKMKTSSDLLKGNLVIAQFTPTDISKRAQTFGKIDLKSSKFGMCILFTSIKCNFFQKVVFYTNQMLFLG